MRSVISIPVIWIKEVRKLFALHWKKTNSRQFIIIIKIIIRKHSSFTSRNNSSRKLRISQTVLRLENSSTL